MLVKGDINIAENTAAHVAFQNCALFIKCITKIDGATIDSAEDLVIPVYYSETTGSLWVYSKDEATNFDVDIEDTNNFKSFSYETKQVANTKVDVDNGIL